MRAEPTAALESGTGADAASQRHTDSRPAGDEGVGPVTSYTLRKGAPEKTRADVVVVGVVRTAEGPAGRAGRRGRGGRAYGRKFAPLLVHARLHRQARRGREGPDRRHDPSRRCWSWSAWATPRAVDAARAAGARPAWPPEPSPTPRPSRWRCPPLDRHAGPRRGRGQHARRLRLHRLQVRPRPARARPRSWCSPTSPAPRRARQALEDGPGRRRRPPRWPATG